MHLQQIHVISLQPAQRLVDLLRGSLAGTSIDLRHQKRLVAVAVAQRLTHPDFTLAAVVVPAVVEKVDALIERRPDDSDALLRVALNAGVVTAQTNDRNLLASTSEFASSDRRIRLRCIRQRRGSKAATQPSRHCSSRQT